MQGMDENRPKNRLASALVVAVMCAALGVYVAGYFLLGSKSAYPSRNDIARTYTAKWLAMAFVPAAFIEAKIAGIAVSLHVAGTRDYPLVEAWSFDP
jgi:hypothetical protein